MDMQNKKKIIHNNDDLLLIPDYTWNDHSKINDMHALAIVKNKTLMCLRDIEPCHLDLLKRIKINSLDTIRSVYGLPDNKIKIFFHYPPSTY